MKILITGASGFIGSHMVEYALKLGYETWAAVRATSSRNYLRDGRIHFIVLDYSDRRLLHEQLREFSIKHGKWDVVIHCAGATKCRRQQEFYAYNFDATRHLVDGLVVLDMVPAQFVFLSTLSVYGPIREDMPFRPIVESDIPRPNTHYGRSKLMAERYIKERECFPYVIFRPTGVYGPRDKDYKVLADGIRRHFEFAIGTQHQDITFVYVKDLVKAVFKAIKRGIRYRCYFVTDGNVYTAHDFADTVRGFLGNPYVMRVRVPLWLGRFMALLLDGVGRLTGRPFLLNSDKWQILCQRNWTCDIAPLVTEVGYVPEFDLRRGVAEMLQT